MEEDLTCPITLDYLESPISLPCCGRAISRLPLVQHLTNSNECPLCRKDLSNFNALNAPVCVNLAYQVEKIKNNNIIQISKAEPKIKISRVNIDNFVYKNVIGQLEIITDDNSNFKHLFIVVVDRSGSMSGNPMENVRYSLTRIVDATYKHKQLITQVIQYDDSCTKFEINRTEPINNYQYMVNNLRTGGGTSFRSAFESIKQVCTDYANNKDVSTISILFLTDGEDSSVRGIERTKLVTNLKIDLDKIIKCKYTVHSVGFGSSHDFNFLNNLKDIGTEQGAYRYADPKESTDILSSKINSVLDVIVTSNVVPISIIKSDLNIIGIADNNKYWVNLTKQDLNAEYNFSISINNGNEILLTSTITSHDEQIDIDKLKNEWYTYLIDEIASEILTLTNIELTLDKKIHCELICQRTKSIMVRLDDTDPNKNRCIQILQTISTICSGGKVDQLKLTDMKFEGKYATAQSTSVQPVKIGNQQSIPSYRRPNGYWNTIKIERSGRCTANKDSPEFYNVLAHYSNSNAKNWIRSNILSGYKCPLIVASSIGRIIAVEELVKDNYVDINITVFGDYNLYLDSSTETYTKKSDGTFEKTEKRPLLDGYCNATDMAILYGYYKTLDILVENGGKPSIDGQLLLRTCISNKFFTTAAKLLKYNFAVVTDDMLNSVPTNEGLEWISANSNTHISYETAIQKGMYDVVKSQVDQIDKIQFSTYVDFLFVKPTADHVKIIELLLENNRFDPNETWNIEDDDITWPLFIASKNGLTDVVDILLNYNPDINKQNKKGTTALWIACCNKHVDIVMKLLLAGADPNLANFKEDGPLIPCCQKGSDTIASLLLEAGANLNCYNKNRDNAVLICCRVGQSKILDLCLKKLNLEDKINILSQCADIDGFNPLLASAEQDRTECIKICITHGADIEFKTTDQNKILPGANALHIACFYGRLNSIKLLLELGADPSSKTNIHGYTILHIAIKQSHKHIVAYIMDKFRSCINICDNENRLPIFYAKTAGNEALYNDFFTNKLSNLLLDAVCVDNQMEQQCANTLLKYGQSICCYDYTNITQIEFDQLDILSTMILNKKTHLLQSILQMGCDISPQAMFWAGYIKTEGIMPNVESMQMVNKVQKIINSNLQNKMLANLDTIPKLCPTENLSTITKMSYGYNTEIKSDTLNTIRKSQNTNHTILGFIDKLKNSKAFNIESILFEAKIHMIKTLIKEEVLQPIHLIVLYLYTADIAIHQQVNLTMESWDKNNLWHPFIYVLNQGLEMIKPFNGEAYRAIDCVFDPNKFMIGMQYEFSTFSVGSTEWGHCTDLINKKKGIIFIIKSKTGRIISSYSKYPANSEIVFLPGTKFTVSDLYVGNIFVLGQANIRKTSYKAGEADCVKASNSEMCMIVELEEN